MDAILEDIQAVLSSILDEQKRIAAALEAIAANTKGV